MPLWLYILIGLFLLALLFGIFLTAIAGQADEDLGLKDRVR